MNKLFPALMVGVFAIGVSAASFTIAAEPATPSTTKKIIKKKAPAKKPAPTPYTKAAPDDDDTGAPIDTEKASSTEYKCELGATLTIFRNAEDDNYIALRYEKLVTRMKRVGTTTGANRFENKKSGLVWIGIPAKGILLDSKLGRQLANDCKDSEQQKPVTTPVVPAAEPAKS